MATVPSVPLDILSPLPKVMSLPVTVKSPLNDVVGAVTRTVPSVLFVMVSSFCKIIPVAPVTSRDVEATNAADVIEVAPVMTPASTLIVPSNTIADPLAGVIFTAPEVVLIVTAASPALTSSALIALAETPVIPEPSPVNVVAATVPATVSVPLVRVIKSVSSV